MKRLVSRLVAGVVVGVAVYVGFSIWADVGRVGEALASFRWRLRAARLPARGRQLRASASCAGSTTCAGSASRRWGPRDSLQVFLAGFALTVTPGKLGEAVKAVLLRASHRIPMAKTAPDRHRRARHRSGRAAAARAGGRVQLRRRPALPDRGGGAGRRPGWWSSRSIRWRRRAIAIAGRLPVLRRFAHRLDDAHAHTAILLAPRPLVVATVLATVSWFFECLAFWVVVRRLPGRAASTCGRDLHLRGDDGRGRAVVPARRPRRDRGGHARAAGAAGSGIESGTAAAATFVTRAATLWFAVALGPAGAAALRAAQTREH